MSDYLMDTNKLIYLSQDKDNQDRKDVLKEIRDILKDNPSGIVITPLIAYEFLRGISWEEKQKLLTLQKILQKFRVLDINSEIANLASDLYRFDIFESRDNKQQRNFEKHKFDSFHFATAKVNDLQILSKNQKDMDRLEKLYQRMIDNKAE